MSEVLKPTSSFGSTHTAALRIFAYAFAVAVPILTKIYLNAPVGIVPIVLLVMPISALGYAARLGREGMGWVRYLSMAVGAGAGFLVLIGIVITPLSAYMSWFDSFKFGTPEGGVSNLFVLISGFYSAVLAPTVLTMGVVWPIITIAFTLLYLVAIVVQSQIYLFLVLGFLLVPSGYVAFRSASRVRREGVFTFSLVLLGVALALSLAVPKFETPPGNKYVNDTLYPRLRSTVVDTFPRFPLLYSVPGYGIRFDEKHLGGTPTLLPNPIFTVSGEPGEVVYLRSRIFDTYDGQSWSMSPYFAGRTTDALRSALFGDGSEARAGDLRVEITSRTFGFIPYTLDSQMIIFGSNFPNIAEGSIDTGFKLRSPLKRGDVVYLRREDSGTTQIEDIQTAERMLYEQIPGDLPTELRVIADGLSEGIDDPEQVLTNIEVFLARNYTYSLDIEELAETFTKSGDAYDDFVYAFLFSETGGYCVQFATSFIILARLNGIPARYATGYLAYTPEDGTPVEVSGLAAHAWPEVWLPNRGWVNWEATPAANIANYTNIGDGWTFNFSANSDDVTTRQIEGLFGASLLDSPSVETRERSDALRIALYILAGLFASAVVSTIVVFVVILVRRISRNSSETFFHHARRLSRRLNRRGVSQPERVGWEEWFTEVEVRMVRPNGELASMKNLILRLTYADDVVTSDHCQAIADFSRQIVKQVRGTNGQSATKSSQI